MAKQTVVKMITTVRGQLVALTSQVELASEKILHIEADTAETKAAVAALHQKIDVLISGIQAGLNGLSATLLNIQNAIGDPPEE